MRLQECTTIKGKVKETFSDCEIRLSLRIPTSWLNVGEDGECEHKPIDDASEPMSFQFIFDSEECEQAFLHKLEEEQVNRIWYVFVDKFEFVMEELPNQPSKLVYHIIITNDNLSWENSTRLIERKILASEVTYSEAQDTVDSFLKEKSCQSEKSYKKSGDNETDLY